LPLRADTEDGERHGTAQALLTAYSACLALTSVSTGLAFRDFLMGSLPATTRRKMHFTGTTVLRIQNGKIAQEIGLESPTILDVPAQSLRAREAEWELGTFATVNIVRHSRRAEITTL
jgi:hypothetical protein